MAKRKRNIVIRFRVTPEEREMIESKMAQFGTTNMAAYLRKISIDGYVVRLDLPELHEMVSLLRRSGNNLNQIAKSLNTYEQVDIHFIEITVNELRNMIKNLEQEVRGV